MKIFISADLEGVNGVMHSSQTQPGEPGYERAVGLLHKELSVVIEGIYETSKVSEIFVADGHWNARNLRHEFFPRGVTLISGWQRPYSMMSGVSGHIGSKTIVDKGFDGVFFLGYHAMAGTAGGVLSHTYRAQVFQEVRLNGVPVGETGLNAALSGYFGVPVAFLSGDDATCNEARNLLGSVTCVPVKKAVSRYSCLALPEADAEPYTPILEALTTLAYKSRRPAFFRGELLAALRILDNGDIPLEQLKGSWAGAMGQTQFIPTIFLKHAVDYDGDGRRDIWNSLPDVFASTAHFVKIGNGWRSGESWGEEVRVPANFPWDQAEYTIQKPVSEWLALGVRSVSGAPPADYGSASILAPGGHTGPVFLLRENFRAIMRYNPSTSYALAVALLADRMAGRGHILAPWPRDEAALSRIYQDYKGSGMRAGLFEIDDKWEGHYGQMEHSTERLPHFEAFLVRF